MTKLALLVLLATSKGATCHPAPPAQVHEPEVHAPGAAMAAAAAAKTDPDIGGPTVQSPPPPPAEPTEAFQPVSARLGGAPWEIKGAGTTGPVQADGSVVVTLANYDVDCGVHTPGPGDKVITLIINWTKGSTVGVAMLQGRVIFAMQFDAKKKKLDNFRDWRPAGVIEVLAAPTEPRTSGRLRIDITSNKGDAVKAEIPVRFCSG